MLRDVGGSRRNKIPFPLLVGEADANIPNTGKNCSTKATAGAGSCRITGEGRTEPASVGRRKGAESHDM